MFQAIPVDELLSKGDVLGEARKLLQRVSLHIRVVALDPAVQSLCFLVLPGRKESSQRGSLKDSEKLEEGLEELKHKFWKEAQVRAGPVRSGTETEPLEQRRPGGAEEGGQARLRTFDELAHTSKASQDDLVSPQTPPGSAEGE